MPVWGAGLADEKLCKALFSEKQKLSLPNNTPGYAIRLELEIEKVEVKIFKAILYYTK